jgi:anti-sigma factor RsiW
VSRDIDDVLAFLERFQLGPAMEKEPILESDLQERLERFADGLCDEQEREEICEALRGDPALVRWVAERVKQRRKASG